MKRCPQCEFIYEDEQNLCDMDGNQLVSDAQSFHVEQDAAAVPITPKRKSGLRLFAVLAIPAVVLGILLPMAFQGSGQPLPQSSDPVSQDSNQSVPAQSIPTPEIAVPAVSPSPSPDARPAEELLSTPDKSASAREEENEQMRSIAKASAESVAQANSRAIGSARSKDGGIKMVEVSSDRSGAFATQPVVTRNREERKPPVVAKAKPSDDKTDSKIGSFLKKTGRILKKPFKL